jgi:magnesium chelatase accessory protein
MADDVRGLLVGMGLARVDLVVGHSAGAAVALRLALSAGQPGNPAIGAVLGIAPSLVPPPALYRLSLGPLLAPLLTSMPSAAAAALIARNTSLVDVLLASTGSQISPTQAKAYRALLADPMHVKGALDFMAATDLPALLAALDHGQALPDMPCEFLLAPDDHWIPQRALEPIIAEHLPSAIIHHCTGGHLLPESQPQHVAQLIEALIARACANGIGR